MHSSRNQTSYQGWVLGLHGEGLITTRVPKLSPGVVAKGAKCEQLEKTIIGDEEEKFFRVEVQLPPWEKKELKQRGEILLGRSSVASSGEGRANKFSQKNIDVFTWSAYKAPRVDPDFICLHLNINPSVLPKKQPPRRSSKEHSNVVKEEVLKLKWARAIKEVFYP